jgi:alpha-tubulin suppressor-like RCC1 family protein
LGTGHTKDCNSPTRVSSFGIQKKTIRRRSSGGFTEPAICASTKSKVRITSPEERIVNWASHTNENKYIVQVSCGAFHTVALSAKGLLWAWGDCAAGQLGFDQDALRTVSRREGFVKGVLPADGGDDLQNVLSPQPLGVMVDTNGSTTEAIFQDISCGNSMTHAISRDGTLYAWGDPCSETNCKSTNSTPKILETHGIPIQTVSSGAQRFDYPKNPAIQ